MQNNVVIRVTRTLILTNTPAGDNLDSCPPPKEYLEPVDPSGAYVVEGYIAAEDGISTETREKGVNELLKFTKDLEGAIDFRVPSRLALDTAVKGA